MSFSLKAGEAALLTGPNGVGKSSLLRLLAGLVAVERGDATLDGASLRRDRDGFQERLLYAGHLDAVKPQLTVEENLAAWAALWDAPEGRAGAALERFRLAHIADYPAAYCSAGQKRRLGLARLLLVDRPLWLLDEPTVSLDVESTATVAEIVREHAAGGGAAIVATHAPLGLEDGPQIRMRPPEPTGDAAEAGGGSADPDDPFLTGSW